jgi:hypothetical protein
VKFDLLFFLIVIDSSFAIQQLLEARGPSK